MKSMLKILVIILQFVAFSSAYAQSFPAKNMTYGVWANRFLPDSTLYLPTGCGVPTDSTFLHDKSAQRFHAAKYYDSCGHQEYTWDPSYKFWKVSIPDSVNGFVTHTALKDSLSPLQININALILDSIWQAAQIASLNSTVSTHTTEIYSNTIAISALIADSLFQAGQIASLQSGKVSIGGDSKGASFAIGTNDPFSFGIKTNNHWTYSFGTDGSFGSYNNPFNNDASGNLTAQTLSGLNLSSGMVKAFGSQLVNATRIADYVDTAYSNSTYVKLSGSYSNPSWLTGVPYSILTGSVPTWNQSTTGQAGSVANSLINGWGIKTLSYNGSSSVSVVSDSSVLATISNTRRIADSAAGAVNLSGLVPYSGATGSVNLGSNNITGQYGYFNAVYYQTASNVPFPIAGNVVYDSSGLNYINSSGNGVALSKALISGRVRDSFPNESGVFILNRDTLGMLSPYLPKWLAAASYQAIGSYKLANDSTNSVSGYTTLYQNSLKLSAASAATLYTYTAGIGTTLTSNAFGLDTTKSYTWLSSQNIKGNISNRSTDTAKLGAIYSSGNQILGSGIAQDTIFFHGYNFGANIISEGYNLAFNVRQTSKVISFGIANNSTVSTTLTWDSLYNSIMSGVGYMTIGSSIKGTGIAVTGYPYKLYVSGGTQIAGTLGLGYISTPSGTPVATPNTTGGTLAANTYYYKIVAVDGLGNTTTGGTEVSAPTTGSTGSVSLSWIGSYGAYSYRIYQGTASGGESQYFTSTVNSATDIGSGYTSAALPTTNNTVSSYITSGTSSATFSLNGQTGGNNSNGSFIVTTGANLSEINMQVQNSKIRMWNNNSVSLTNTYDQPGSGIGSIQPGESFWTGSMTTNGGGLRLVYSKNGSTADAIFYYNNGTLNEQMRVFSSTGDVGIGVSGVDAGYKFYNNGTSYLNGNVTVGGSIFPVSISSTDVIGNSTTPWYNGYFDNLTIGYASISQLIYNVTTHSILPYSTNSFDLGGTSLYWNNLYVNSINGSAYTVSSSGTYIPTLTNTTNLTASSIGAAMYTRNGNIVKVTLSGTMTATSIGSSTVLTISLPITTSSGSQGHIGIMVNQYGSGTTTGDIGINTTTTAQLTFQCTQGNGAPYNFTAEFTYSL